METCSVPIIRVDVVRSCSSLSIEPIFIILRTNRYRPSEERLKASQHTYPDYGNIFYLRNVGFNRLLARLTARKKIVRNVCSPCEHKVIPNCILAHSMKAKVIPRSVPENLKEK